MIIADAFKFFFNRGEIPNLFFWRDNIGLEVDLLLEQGEKLYPIEVKAGATIHSSMLDNLKKWKVLAGDLAGPLTLVHGGEQHQKRTEFKILPWFSIDQMLTSMTKTR
jgi:hypothetical protein